MKIRANGRRHSVPVHDHLPAARNLPAARTSSAKEKLKQGTSILIALSSAPPYPTTSTLSLQTHPELRADYFLERRELGVLNLGGAGTVTRRTATNPCPSINWTVSTSAKAINPSPSPAATATSTPAAFYLLSYPAHATYPTALAHFKDLQPVSLGSVGDLQQAL